MTTAMDVDQRQAAAAAGAAEHKGAFVDGDEAPPAHAPGEPSDEDEDDDGRAFEAFERRYAADNSWEALQEDERGFLRPLDATAELRARRQRAVAAARAARVRRGVMRYMLLVVDLSRAAGVADMRPSRQAVMLGAARALVRRFFELNPLGQLGVAVLRRGVAERLTELGGAPEAQVATLRQYGLDAGGDASLQNGLELVLEMLRGAPPYGHREALVLMAALSTVDPGRVEDTIAACRAARVRVSVVGVAAEVHVLRRAADATGGTYGVALNEAHLSELLLAHAPPPPAPPGALGAELVRMGFPARAPGGAAAAVFVGELPVLLAGGYTCPRCKARTQELPCRCHVCGLTLISSPHLARSYRHLFPVPPYAELQRRRQQQEEEEEGGDGADGGDDDEGGDEGGDEGDDGGGDKTARAPAVVPPPWHEPGGRGGGGGGGAASTPSSYCFGCLKPLFAGGAPAAAGAAPQPMVLRCRQCRQLFCVECDALVHEALHNCPGCECAAAAAATAPQPESGA